MDGLNGRYSGLGDYRRVTMDPDRYRRLKELVSQACELPQYERDVFLQEHCDDVEL